MKASIGTGALALALLLTGCGGGESDDKAGNSAAPAGTAAGTAAAPVAPPEGGDWTQAVAETPEGGFRMGNPNAPVKLVEYASLTCPHCAEFSEAATETLKNDYVKNGQVSWEFRHFMLFPTDPGMSLLSRCQGAGPFFHLMDQLYAEQRNWVQKVQALSDAQYQQIQTLPPQQAARALVKSAGLDEFFRQRGVPQAKIDACLNDPQALQRLAELQNLGAKEGVTGTPTFFINGEKVESAANWAALKPALDKALGR